MLEDKMKDVNINVQQFRDAVNQSDVMVTAIAIRTMELVHQSHFGFIHGSHEGLGHAEAIKAIIEDKLLSNLPVNDSTVDGYVKLNELRQINPILPRTVIRYNNVHYSGHTADGAYKQANLYKFHPFVTTHLEIAIPRGNGDRPNWGEVAFIFEDGETKILPSSFIRGIDPADVDELEFDDALNELAIPEDLQIKLKDKLNSAYNDFLATAQGRKYIFDKRMEEYRIISETLGELIDLNPTTGTRPVGDIDEDIINMDKVIAYMKANDVPADMLAMQLLVKVEMEKSQLEHEFENE